LTPKEKQKAFMLAHREKELQVNSCVTQSKKRITRKTGKITPKSILSNAFQETLDYLLNLSASGQRDSYDWQQMKKKLTKADHWKKSYKK